VTFISHLGS